MSAGVAPTVAGGARRRAVEGVGALLVAAVAALAVLRYVWPSRLAGVRGGVVGFLGGLGEHHPLFVLVAAFIVLAEVGRYWRRRWGMTADEARAAARAPGRQTTKRLVIALAVTATAAFVLRASIVAMYRVVGPSMLPTLEMGDRVLVNRLAYGVKHPFGQQAWAARTPARGDLVVFSASGVTGAGGPESVVKRVIGVPGDRIGFDRGSIVVNDVAIPACDAGPYVNLTGSITVRGRLVVEFLGEASYLTVRKPLEAEFPTTTVRPGEVFVLGDDRGMSTDSRVWSEGHGTGVPIAALDGRVMRVLAGARPDGRLDPSRLLVPAGELKVRLPGIDLGLTEQRIATCLERRRAGALPDPTGRRR